GSEKLFLREVFTSVQDSGSLSGYIRTYVFKRVLIHVQLLDKKLVMEKRFLDKEEDNATIRICVSQNNLQELKEVWDQWDDEIKKLFYCTMVICPIYSMLKWKSTKLCSVAQRSKSAKVILEPPTSRLSYKKLISITRMSERITPVPAILIETFRSLSACRRAGEGIFIGCAQFDNLILDRTSSGYRVES
ncbi:hypothetical protein Goshw_009815, partial [Gossypium schwendimanii]|nr:hypothetical protein [Gossypium schwendimanii]